MSFGHQQGETLVLLMGIMFPQEAHHVDYPFDPHIHTSAKLVCPASLICFPILHLQDTLHHNSLSSSTHPHGLHSWVLAEDNQADVMWPMGSTRLPDTLQNPRKSAVPRRLPPQTKLANAAGNSIW